MSTGNVQKIWPSIHVVYVVLSSMINRSLVIFKVIFENIDRDLAKYDFKEMNLKKKSAIVHIKQDHLGLKDVKRPTRGPASGPNCWIISPTLLTRLWDLELSNILSCRPI